MRKLSSDQKPIWETAGDILRGKESPQKAIVLGIYLMIAGAGMLGVGDWLRLGTVSAVGGLLLIGGIILFITGIDEYFKSIRHARRTPKPKTKRQSSRN